MCQLLSTSMRQIMSYIAKRRKLTQGEKQYATDTLPTSLIAPIDIWLLAFLALVAIGAGVTKRHVKF
jgi:hypothetical protein